MKKNIIIAFALFFLGSLILLAAPQATFANEDSRTLTSPSTTFTAQQSFLLNYTGVQENCVILRVLKSGTGEYILPSSASASQLCDRNENNYLSFRADGRGGVGGMAVDGLAPGSYYLELLNKDINKRFKDGDTYHIAYLEITVDGAAPEPGSCEDRKNSGCDVASYPICVKNTGSCSTPPNCAMAGDNGTINCTYPSGSTISFPDDRVTEACPICPYGSTYNSSDKTCGNEGSPTFQNCAGSDNCSVGIGCMIIPPPVDPPCIGGIVVEPTTNPDGGCLSVNSAIGPLLTEPGTFIPQFLAIFLSLSGGVALLLIIRSGYQLLTSQGDAEKVKEARERITSAIIGILFMIFSLVILQTIGVDILHIPGFAK